MSNPFQEQFLKAGLVSKEQVKKANQAKSKKQHQQKKQRGRKQLQADKDAAALKARQAAQQKAEHDRELNRQRQDQAQLKAISKEIDQLIREHHLKRDESCDIAYNFEHRDKVRRIYVNAEMKQNIVAGKLGIARIEGRYELVPMAVAQKIQQRNDKRVVLFETEAQTADADDAYADYQVPDDLMW
ncbi:MAG: DUF2058 family protein [Gammaproteobacteria bacterium]|nr:DUF2058 family protein [Gammaproteobacteria bacterium]